MVVCPSVALRSIDDSSRMYPTHFFWNSMPPQIYASLSKWLFKVASRAIEWLVHSNIFTASLKIQFVTADKLHFYNTRKNAQFTFPYDFISRNPNISFIQCKAQLRSILAQTLALTQVWKLPSFVIVVIFVKLTKLYLYNLSFYQFCKLLKHHNIFFSKNSQRRVNCEHLLYLV